MKGEPKPESGKPARKEEAQSSTSPTPNVGTAPTTGATTIGKLRHAVLTERVRVHVDVISTSLDALMNQPDLCSRIQKQMLIAWLMVQNSSLPYHDSECAVFSETLLDILLDLLGSHMRSDAERKKNGGPTGGGGGGEADAETTVFPQPSGSPAVNAVAVEVPKPEAPRPARSPKRPIDPDLDRGM